MIVRRRCRGCAGPGKTNIAPSCVFSVVFNRNRGSGATGQAHLPSNYIRMIFSGRCPMSKSSFQQGWCWGDVACGRREVGDAYTLVTTTLDKRLAVGNDESGFRRVPRPAIFCTSLCPARHLNPMCRRNLVRQKWLCTKKGAAKPLALKV